ncbi:MAG: GntR family transcriptional regulator [Sodalis sp. (in: enterobacteria)]|uniref:GntR family transcriptional regulator n=1 Tax=Sodalis sp. (in: enterobacteria) TaxID=1898979 RepID=UPI003F36A057
MSFIAYEKIKAMILNMELQPSSALTEMWLIGKLDMSRTPIREALYRLQQERFVELARHIRLVCQRNQIARYPRAVCYPRGPGGD